MQNGYQFTSVDMKHVALNLALRLDHPVIDETGIDYTFDAEMTYDPDHPESIREAVRESMGLQLAPERRVMPIWIVRAPEQ
jgi:uncharacterized protein (TIGR03435 family)